MRKVNLTINQIIDQIKAIQGQNVDLEVAKGRKKVIKLEGIIESVYPSIFTIKTQENDSTNSYSYSYADVLCGEVSLKVKKD